MTRRGNESRHKSEEERERKKARMMVHEGGTERNMQIRKEGRKEGISEELLSLPLMCKTIKL